jgi:phage tail P2-like protein
MAELYPVVNSFPDEFKIPPAERIEHPGALTLYQQSTGFEKAAADTEAERLMDLYAEAIIDQWNPWQVAYEHLPFLAWAQGVNLWENWWDETFRRNWVARQWYLKSIRGKRAGLDEFVAAVGGQVKRCVVPPARAYGTRKQTAEERAAYVARFPQLRIYPYVAREQLPWLCFVGKHYDGTGLNRVFQKNGSFLGPRWKLYPTVQDAGGKYTRTATLYEPRTGVETTLTIRKIERVYTGENAGWGYTPGVSVYDEMVILPLEKRPNYFIGEIGKHLHGAGKYGIFLGKQLPLRTISIGRSGPIEMYQGKAEYQTIFPQEDLLQVRPEYVAIKHPRRPTELYAARGEYLSRPSRLVAHIVARSLAIAPPDFGRALFKGFAGEDLEVGSPVFGAAVLKQHHFGIEAVDLIAPTPWIGEPGYVMRPAVNVTVSVPVFSAAILRHSARAAAMSTGSPTFTVPALKQAHKLNSFAITVGAPTFSRPGYAIKNGNMAVGSPVLGAPVLVHLF